MPITNIDTDGLGAFVPLDYTTTNFTKRFEHAIVLLPKTWDSMYHLIRAPQKYVEAYRNRYLQTPFHRHKGALSDEWGFKGPITIVVESIATPTPSNSATLEALSSLYPGFLVPAKNWADLSPKMFLNALLLANQPQSASNVTGFPGDWKVDEGMMKTGYASFPFQYIAEFALETSVLTIKYFPHNKRAKRKFKYPITLKTLNPVKNTKLVFLHFDCDFENNHTPKRVADARARFAMDFIANPGFINHLKRPHPSMIEAHVPFLPANNSFSLPDTASPAVPHPKPRVNGIGITITSMSPVETFYQPKIVIDSVWPNPESVPNSATTPPLCYLLVTGPVHEDPPNSGHWFTSTGEAIEKAYAPNVVDGPVVGPGNDPSGQTT